MTCSFPALPHGAAVSCLTFCIGHCHFICLRAFALRSNDNKTTAPRKGKGPQGKG
ncbi:hypothetical protein G4L79_001509 [Salmonella enterica]|nr:hypothetical protein [Salmonella enterica]